MIGAADIICSTLGKAVSGAAGGYTTGPKELVTLLRNVSRPYLFSNAPPPAIVTAALKVNLNFLFKSIKEAKISFSSLGTLKVKVQCSK